MAGTGLIPAAKAVPSGTAGSCRSPEVIAVRVVVQAATGQLVVCAVGFGVDGDLAVVGDTAERALVPVRATAMKTMRGPVLGSVAWPEYSWPMF